jgi:D-3-phosphoglycerate dehydrogenase
MNRAILSMIDASAGPEVPAPLRHFGVVVESAASQDLLLQTISEFDAFLTSLTVQTNRDVLDRATRLKVVATPSTGTDHIDVAEAQRRGIVVLSLKDDIEFLRTVTATAELAWGLLLAVVRRLPAATRAAREGRWGRDEFRGRQLSGKTLGVVGYGRLGTMVAEYGRAFGMRTIVCDEKEVAPPAGIHQVSFHELLAKADVVSIHVHLSESTRRLFDTAVFRRMKPEAVLINTSRGAVIDEGALLDALTSKRLAGAGVDVIDGEWRDDLDRHPLIRYANEHDNLVITPHIGGVTWESQARAYERIVQTLVRFFETQS